MTYGFVWGGINLRKLFAFFLKNFWMVITAMLITYLGLGLIDQRTNNPAYTYRAVAAVYPMSSSYRFHTIENSYDLSNKTNVIGSVLNSEIFQSEFHNQYPDFQDFTIDCTQIANTDLLVLHATSSKAENASEGIQAAIEFFSKFSGNVTGNADIKIIYRQNAPTLAGDSSKIQSNRSKLSVLSGMMVAGLFILMHVLKKTYKTEGSLRKRFKNVRFFSLPIIKSELESKKGLFSKKNSLDPIKILTLEIKQALHKRGKKSLFVTSYADQAGGGVFLSELARELAKQNENVILIGRNALQRDVVSGPEESDGRKQHSISDVIHRQCTVKDALFYNEELKVYCIQCDPDSIGEDISYSVDDARRVLGECLRYTNLVLLDGTAMFSSHYAQIWQEAVDASVALCRSEDADYFKVDQMLNNLQESDTYFAGCVLSGF